jgi:hypothetical protein
MILILDEEPMDDLSFNEQSAIVVIGSLYGEHVNGCYSEWTCGYGGFDYVNNNGHSIFNELESNIGKSIHLSL